MWLSKNAQPYGDTGCIEQRWSVVKKMQAPSERRAGTSFGIRTFDPVG
jgi:hypothetical protein